jgi:hypothetical protein
VVELRSIERRASSTADSGKDPKVVAKCGVGSADATIDNYLAGSGTITEIRV